MKLLPSPGRALVTSNKFEKPGSALGPKAERMICRCTSRNSSEMRVRIQSQSIRPARSRETASMEDGPRNGPAEAGIGPSKGVSDADVMVTAARSCSAVEFAEPPSVRACSTIAAEAAMGWLTSIRGN